MCLHNCIIGSCMTSNQEFENIFLGDLRMTQILVKNSLAFNIVQGTEFCLFLEFRGQVRHQLTTIQNQSPQNSSRTVQLREAFYNGYITCYCDYGSIMYVCTVQCYVCACSIQVIFQYHLVYIYMIQQVQERV